MAGRVQVCIGVLVRFAEVAGRVQVCTEVLARGGSVCACQQVFASARVAEAAPPPPLPAAIEQQMSGMGMPMANPLSMLMGGGGAAAPLKEEKAALAGARHVHALGAGDAAAEEVASAALREALRTGAIAPVQA